MRHKCRIRAAQASCVCTVAIAILLLLRCAPLVAQSSLDKVHVAPQGKHTEPAAFNTIDPRLNAGGRPFVKDVQLVLVPVTVTDGAGQLVAGLSKKDFELYDEEQQQTITSFLMEDAPLSIGVVFDTSGSMAKRMAYAREAITKLFELSNPDDEFFVVSVSNEPRIVHGFTNNIRDIAQELERTPAHGRTALLDGIGFALAHMRDALNQRQALVIISDGGDNYSRLTDLMVKDMVRESDVVVYAIALTDYKSPTREEQFGPQLLSEITTVTGGRTFPVRSAFAIPQAASAIGLELRNQYVLGYKMPGSFPGAWHHIEVKLSKPVHPAPHLYAKTGYLAAE